MRPAPLPPSYPAASPQQQSGRAHDAAKPDDDARRRETLRGVSTQFEAMFLAEMLKHAGSGQRAEEFDGGAGEAAFGGMLISERAKLMTEAGGVGLAEHIFKALLRREGLDDAK